MAIPSLDEHGLLPPGIFDCTLAEIRRIFGGFQMTDQRPKLFVRLEEMVNEMKRSSLFESLLVDGSFVTAKSIPNDIDILAVLRAGHNFERDLLMSEYALVSRSMLRRRFGFDVVVAETKSTLYFAYVEFFSRIREHPGLRKGLLRLNL